MKTNAPWFGSKTGETVACQSLGSDDRDGIEEA
jgi:hypothetical protein